MNRLIAIGAIALLFSCSQSKEQPNNNNPAPAPAVKVAKIADLEQLINNDSGKLYVINFWATWCKPCIEELPYFEAAKVQFAGKPVEFVLVSLDIASELNQKLIPFVERKKLQSEVWLLDEPDANTWIEKIDAKWDGAIPVTLIVNKQKGIRQFVGKEVSQEELNNLISSNL